MSDLKRIRTLKGFTVKEVSDGVGISKQRYSQIEKEGLNSTKEDVARKIAELLGVNIFVLMGLEVLKVKPRDEEEWKTLTSVLNKIKRGQ